MWGSVVIMSGKRLHYGFVKEQFEIEGFVLLSKEYKNWKTKLEYLCPSGHTHSISYHNWKKGYRCPYCANDKKRKHIDEIKKSFELYNYTLLSSDYINNKSKLEYICPNGHKHSITWNAWRSGKRCYYCYGNLKPTYGFVKESFEKCGYRLISDRYDNNRTKLEYICPNGHKHSITWNDWRSGYMCPYCAGNIKLEIGFVKKQFENENYILLSREYKNSSSKLEYSCPYGHIHEITYSNWSSGWRCPTCKGIRQSMRTGKDAPFWKGGTSLDPYCDIWKDKEYKKDIRDRDGNKCLNPYCISECPEDLTIHHIDYNKKNCNPSNLITVCRSCNSRANKDKRWHKGWYQAIMYRRYGCY